MSTGTSCHFGHLLQVSKKSLWSLILYNFFHDFIHVYSPGAGAGAGAGADSPQGTVLISTEMSSLHSFVASLKKMSLKSDFIQFFSWFNTCIWPKGRGRQPPGDKNLMSTERPYHFTHLLQVSKKSLWSLILYNFFHDLIHVYSPRAGVIQPPGDKVLMSTKTSCHFGHLLLVSNHRLQQFLKNPLFYLFPIQKHTKE